MTIDGLLPQSFPSKGKTAARRVDGGVHTPQKKNTQEDSLREKGENMEILKNLAALIKVKTIVTLIVTAIFAVMALRGTISADNVMIIVSMVVSFYFGTQTEKK